MGKSAWFGVSLVVSCALLACKKEEPASYPQPQVVGTYPNAVPTATTPAATPTAAPTSVPGAPAVGLPCASEQDLQCAFAHCISGRCGGCRSNADCKPGSQCMQSLFGYACFPVAPQPGSTPAQTPISAPVAVAVPATPTNGADPLDALRARCVQRTNEYRASVSAAPVARRLDREACADGAARNDGASGAAHGAFGRCQEGAQNECPGWPGSAEQVVDKCLAQMFAEGPGPFDGHGHYLNMTAAQYTGVACGFATAADGKLWIVQNFYR
ncbi:MAG TPA: CAP domain-containing protein [Polyangiaceae bacterium]|nr:CAP domain-containing protein [Polyangiaceae bacterium]